VGLTIIAADIENTRSYDVVEIIFTGAYQRLGDFMQRYWEPELSKSRIMM